MRQFVGGRRAGERWLRGLRQVHRSFIGRGADLSCADWLRAAFAARSNEQDVLQRKTRCVHAYQRHAVALSEVDGDIVAMGAHMVQQ